MRVAVVASLVVHAGLIAWISALAPRPRPPASPPSETLVTVVVLDPPTPEPAAAKLPAPHASTAGAPHRARNLVTAGAVKVPLAAPTAVSDAAPAPRGSLAMRGIDLSPARIAELVPPRDGAPPPAAHASELRPSAHGTYTTDLGGSDWRDRTATAHVARDGTVRFDNAPDFDIHFVGLGVMGKFNVDDWLARKAGIDPYASAKLAYLDRTRDERVRLAQANRAAELAHPAVAMQRNLEAARAISDPATRKQALFELWDDVAETGDVALVRAGADARAYLLGAIRAMRPALELTPDELAQLNARRHSRAVFAPYD